MKKEDLVVLETGSAYTALFNKANYYTPYIVAWHFDPDSSLKDAKKFFAEQEKANANCKYCENIGCPHRDALRRLPRERGGLGLCKNFG